MQSVSRRCRKLEMNDGSVVSECSKWTVCTHLRPSANHCHSHLEEMLSTCLFHGELALSVARAPVSRRPRLEREKQAVEGCTWEGEERSRKCQRWRWKNWQEAKASSGTPVMDWNVSLTAHQNVRGWMNRQCWRRKHTSGVFEAEWQQWKNKGIQHRSGLKAEIMLMLQPKWWKHTGQSSWRGFLEGVEATIMWKVKKKSHYRPYL